MLKLVSIARLHNPTLRLGSAAVLKTASLTQAEIAPRNLPSLINARSFGFTAFVEASRAPTDAARRSLAPVYQPPVKTGRHSGERKISPHPSGRRTLIPV